MINKLATIGKLIRQTNKKKIKQIMRNKLYMSFKFNQFTSGCDQWLIKLPVDCKYVWYHFDYHIEQKIVRHRLTDVTG